MSAEPADMRELVGAIVESESQEASDMATKVFARQVGLYYKTLRDIAAMDDVSLGQLTLSFQNNLFLAVHNAPKG